MTTTIADSKTGAGNAQRVNINSLCDALRAAGYDEAAVIDVQAGIGSVRDVEYVARRMQECGVMTNVPFAGVVDFVNKYGFTMAGDLEVVWLVTLDEPHGFYYLTDTETGRFTMEHDDAWPFYSEAAADAVAVQFAVKGAKAGVLCSAMRRRVPQLIGEASLPAEFRSENMFGGTEAEFKARTVAFRAYCKANSIFYYGRPRESFSSWEAFQLCKAAGCAKLLLDDLS